MGNSKDMESDMENRSEVNVIWYYYSFEVSQ